MYATEEFRLMKFEEKKTLRRKNICAYHLPIKLDSNEHLDSKKDIKDESHSSQR